MDKSRLSYWFPKLSSAGLPVPKTIMIEASDCEMRAIWQSFEAAIQDGVKGLAARVKSAADTVGYPAFLRTDYFSGKHDWKDTCYINKDSDIAQHIVNIAYFWEMVNMVASPCDIWVIREFLPTIPQGVCRGYGNMPICKEFRFFVNDGEIVCWHPYWPEEALKDGDAIFHSLDFSYTDFCATDEIDKLTELAKAVGRAVGGGTWSVDILETRRGWFVTDMAEASMSYHWEDCPHRDDF